METVQFTKYQNLDRTLLQSAAGSFRCNNTQNSYFLSLFYEFIAYIFPSHA